MNVPTPHLIQWQQAWFVGFSRFDQEHVELMDLANAITIAIHENQPQDVLDRALQKLMDRTAKHFDDEEALMVQTYYSHLEQHRASHDRLVRSLVRFAAKCRSHKVAASESGEFLLDWLLEHVLQADIYYAPYFNERGLN